MTPRSRTIVNVKDALEVLGGVEAVASWLGATSDALLMMRHRGYIARGYHLHFYLTLQSRGFEIAPELFGLTTFDRLIMPARTRRPKGRLDGHRVRHA